MPERTPSEGLARVDAALTRLEESSRRRAALLADLDAGNEELSALLDRIEAGIEGLLPPPPGKPGPAPIERRNVRLVADERKAA